MNSNAILTSDVLDLLFENRNKSYGAYTLRKFYPNRIKTSLLIMLGTAAVLSAFTFLPDKKNASTGFTFSDSMIVRQFTEEKLPEQPKPKPQIIVQPAGQKFLSNMLIVQSKDSADKLNEITHLQISNTTTIDIEDPGMGEVNQGVTGGGTEITFTKPAEPVLDNNHPEDNPDVQASFPGGEKALLNFLQRNLLPPADVEAGEAIQVKIKFVVGFDGNLQSFDVVQDGGTIFNNEVIRVLKKMPKWNPGKKGGRNVPVYYCVPVKFTATE